MSRADPQPVATASGQLPVAVVDPTDEEDLASDPGNRRERRGQHVV
jgi:hypothetical protein